MTQEHPLTPPPELIENWIEMAKPLPQRPPNPGELAALAARWGADQELEACCQEVQDWYGNGSRLHTARRPKPPSLKEQAIAALDELDENCRLEGFECSEKVTAIRRALESLPD